jgi:hypothetical protein
MLPPPMVTRVLPEVVTLTADSIWFTLVTQYTVDFFVHFYVRCFLYVGLEELGVRRDFEQYIYI